MRLRQRLKNEARVLQRSSGLGYAQAQKMVAQREWDRIAERIEEIAAEWQTPATLLMLFYELCDGRWHEKEDLLATVRRRHANTTEIEDTYEVLLDLARGDLDRHLEVREDVPAVRLVLCNVRGLPERIEFMRVQVRKIVEFVEPDVKFREPYRLAREEWDVESTEMIRRVPAVARVPLKMFAVLCDPRWHPFRELLDGCRACFTNDELDGMATTEDDGFAGEAALRDAILRTNIIYDCPEEPTLPPFEMRVGSVSQAKTIEAMRWGMNYTGHGYAGACYESSKEMLLFLSDLWRRNFDEWTRTTVRQMEAFHG